MNQSANVRSVEANLDAHHFPFVHGSMMPGIGQRLDPYEVHVEGTRIRTHGQLRREGRSKGFSFRVDFEAPTLTRHNSMPSRPTTIPKARKNNLAGKPSICSSRKNCRN